MAARRRKIRAHLAIAVFGFGTLGGGLAELDQRFWPFSQYAMFSGGRPDRFSYWELRGVLPGPVSAELPLRGQAYFGVFNHLRLIRALQRSARGKKDRSELLTSLAEIRALYERRRRRGLHAGPPLRAVRLYRVDAESAAVLREGPDAGARVLLLEER